MCHKSSFDSSYETLWKRFGCAGEMLSVGDRLMRMSPSVSAYTAAVTFGIIHSTKFAIACDRHPTPSSLSSVLSENCGSTFDIKRAPSLKRRPAALLESREMKSFQSHSLQPTPPRAVADLVLREPEGIWMSPYLRSREKNALGSKPWLHAVSQEIYPLPRRHRERGQILLSCELEAFC